ncbi:amidohydrolase family protein [Maribacter sp. 2307UL18-2]|uniref:amidohydrolase family protein n=1 Tax=Maribacter sp. 2307UL18-2 TaxID=3386274 RepID=UPI0039BCFBFB
MKKLALSLLLIVFVSCGQSEEKISPTAILISNVNQIDVTNGSLLKNRQIVIDSGKIKRITDDIENPGAYTTTIDGTGKYVIPGLAEMHAHIPPPSTPAERVEEVLFLYVANGITTIRGMLGHPGHLTLREVAKEGRIISPRIFTSSPSLNGNSVTSKEEAIQKVSAYQKAGYDFLKIHPGIQREVFDQVVATANEVGIPFAGHVPVDIGIRHALKSRYASIDHVDGFLEGLVPESANVKPTDNGFFGYAFTPLANTSKIDELVALANQNEVWIVPTQSLFERWFAPISSDELLQQPEMVYMPKTTLQNWKTRKDESINDPSFNTEQWKKFDGIRKELIAKLNANGHGMLLGSDAPQLFNVPGFSIHHEIQGMIGAGMTPLEILKSGTVNPARYFDMEDTFGDLKVGLEADMVLLESNPLDDMTALQEIAGVMLRGRWIPKEEIDEKLAIVAKHASQN